MRQSISKLYKENDKYREQHMQMEMVQKQRE